MLQFLIISGVILLLTGSIVYAIIITSMYFAMRDSMNFWKNLAITQAKNIAEKEKES